jgi:oxygen-independent coproporphyrinogen-3 oxidase
LDAGHLAAPSEDAQAALMEQAAETLAAAGLERYEVASYARDGFACRHNSAYWTGVPYLGLGTGAAGMRNLEDGSRERLYEGKIIEHLTPAEAACEDLMLGMRMSRGVSLEAVAQAAQLTPRLLDTFEELIALGLVELSETSIGPRYRPTPKGWLLGNELYGRIMR